MTQTKPVTMAIPGDPEDIALRDVPQAIASRNFEILDLARQLTAKEKECDKLQAEIERLTALQPDYLKACLDAGIEENARLLKLALWSAREGGDRCDACMIEAAKLWAEDFDEPSRLSGSALVEDMLLTLDGDRIEEYCEGGGCGDPAHIGGWVAYVPEGETLGVQS